MQYYKLLIIGMLLFATMGELEEIETQNIRLNEYIRQHAVIQNIGDTVYYTPCDDCTCTIDMFDGENKQLIDDGSTIELSIGLFGYRATSQYFLPNKDYYVLFNCTSIEHGSGLVSSTVHVDEGIGIGDISVSTDEGVSPLESGGLFSGFWTEFKANLNNILITLNEYFFDSWLDLIAPTRQEGLRSRVETGNLLYDMLIGLWNASVYMINLFTSLLVLIKLALTDPAEFINQMWKYNLWLIYAFFTVTLPVFVIFLFIQMWFMNKSLGKGFFPMIETWLMLNISLVMGLYGFINIVLNLIMGLFNIAIRVLSGLRNLLPF